MTKNIEIEVDTLAIAYTADVKDGFSFHLSWGEWKNFFSNLDHPQKMEIEKSITLQQRKEALTLKSHIEADWNPEQERVVTEWKNIKLLISTRDIPMIAI